MVGDFSEIEEIPVELLAREGFVAKRGPDCFSTVHRAFGNAARGSDQSRPADLLLENLED
ncbi:hypothetical protein ACIP93_36835 [Streptomyces sp. NPDC088745]|uniref:hypothetical protein n=1 Tax=Streptomyces sp. NPDC088745 TaxID=3365884 RepID=UPI003825747E